MTKAERTRAYIVEQTAPVFNKRGYAGTSMTDLTNATGLTKGSIYANFTNKDDVALAAFDFNWQKLNSLISNEMNEKVSVVDKLLVYADVYYKIIAQTSLSGGCPVLNTAIEADDTHPALKKKAAGALIKWRKSLATLIRDGMAKKEIKNSTQPDQSALTLIALIEGSIMISKVSDKPSVTKALKGAITKFILDLR